MERIEGLSIGLDLDSLKVESNLTDLKSAMRQMNSEMKSNLSVFDRADKSMGKYQTTIDGLSKKILLQQKIVDKARISYEKMVAEHGEGSKEAQKAATQYNNQSASLQNMQKSLQRAQQGLSDLQEEQRIAASGWSKVSGAADKASSRISSIGDDIKGVGQNIAISITAPIAGAFAGLTKGTDDFRGEMAVLENNAREAGVGVDTIRSSMERLSAISKETDSNVEALSNLLALNFSDSGMNKTLDALSGAVLKFPDTLKIEGVADGLQETLATGAAIGPFGELLERMGVNLDTFNDGLTNAIKNGDEENYILQQLADMGLADVNESFRKNNEELVKSREESQKFQQATADLGATLTPIMTKITTGLTNVTNWFNNLSPEGKKLSLVFGGIAAALGPLITFIGIFITVLGNVIGALAPVMASIAKAGGLLNWLKIGFTALPGPVGITIAVITALATGFTVAYKKSETFRDIVHAVRDAIVSAYQKVKEFLTTNPQFLAFLDSVRNGFAKAKDMIMQAFGVAMDFVREKIGQLKAFWDSDGQQFLQAWMNVWNGIRSVVQPIIDAIVAAIKWAFPYIKVVIQTAMSLVLGIIKMIWGNIKGVINGALDIIMGAVKIFSGLFTGDFSKMWEGIKQMFMGAIQFVWNFVQLMFFGRLIKGVVGLAKGFGSRISSMWANIKDIFSRVGNWIVEFIKGRFTAMRTTVTNVTTVISNVISAIWNGILSFFRLVIRTIIDFVRGRFNSMRDAIRAIFTGIRDIAKSVWSSIKNNIINPVKSAAETAGKRFSGFRDKVTGIFSNLRDKIGGYVEKMIDTVKGMPKKMGDGLKNAAGKIGDGIGAVKDKMVGGLATGVNLVIDGVNWVLDKVGVDKKKHLGKWVPEYAHGTDGHPGGLAIVGDGKGRNAGPELIQTPDGKMSLSPARDTLVNLPKGSSVLSALNTRNLLGDIPKYGWGVGDIVDAGKTVLSKGGKLIKGAGKAIKDKAFDIWEYISDPSKLFKKALDFVGFEMPNLPGAFKPATSGIVNKLIEGATGFVKNKIADFGSFDSNASGNVKSWISAAMRRTGVPSSWLDPLTTIAMKESGGRTGPSTINKWDINWKRGIPSMGLMQTIGPTFNAFKEKGWNDIMNPSHNAAAAINYIKSRYGNVFNVPGIKALRQGRPYVGYATGGRIENNGLYQLAEEGHPEWIIPTDPNRRTEAMKLLALAGREITGNKRPNQLPNPTGRTGDSVMTDVINLLREMVGIQQEQLQAIMNGHILEIDGKRAGQLLEKYITDQQNRKKGRGGRYAPKGI
jgi:SLT domain-containing protein/phage-related protein